MAFTSLRDTRTHAPTQSYLNERTSHEQDTQLKGNGTQGKRGLNHLLALFTVVAAVMVFAGRSTSPPSTKAKKKKAEQKKGKKKKSVVRHAQKRGQFKQEHVLPPGVLT